MHVISWLKILLWPLEPSGWLARWPLSPLASCFMFFTRLCSSRSDLHVVPARVWLSLSPLGLPGWRHPLSVSPFFTTWLIPVGRFWKSAFNQICPGSALLLHLLAHRALFCFSVSSSTRPLTSCLLCLCTSQLSAWHTVGAQSLLNEGLVTCAHFLWKCRAVENLSFSRSLCVITAGLHNNDNTIYPVLSIVQCYPCAHMYLVLSLIPYEEEETGILFLFVS